MAVTPFLYGLALQSLVEGRIDLTHDPLMCMLCDNDYTPNVNTHKFRSVVTDEIVGSGYTNGGKQVTGVSATYTQATKTLTIAGGNMSWPVVTLTNARYAVLYMAPIDVPITQQPLLAYVDFGANQSRAGQPFYINWPVTGIARLVLP